MVNKSKNRLEFYWPDTGKLTILTNGNYSAKLRFYPSKKVIQENLQKMQEGSRKARGKTTLPRVVSHILGAASRYLGKK